MSRMVAVLLAVLVTTAAAANLPSPSRLVRRSSPSQDEAGVQKRANLLALLEDDDVSEPSDNPVLGERLTEEEAEALVKYLQEPVGGIRRPVLGVYRNDENEQVDREKKTTRLLSWAAEMLRMMTTKGGFQFRFGKRDVAEGQGR